MSAVLLDTETTGTTDDDKVIEFALTELMAAPPALTDDLFKITSRVFRFSTDRPISLGAMATHHIIGPDLEGFPPFMGWDPAAEGIEYIVGHNVDFDWRMLGRPKVRRICTLALARSLWPDIDSHSLGAMIYHLESPQLARQTVQGAHSAEADIRMILNVLLPEILIKLVPRGATWEELWTISEDARIPKVMPFGKHKGVPLGDVPSDYKRWMLNQPDVDPYLKIALRGR